MERLQKDLMNSVSNKDFTNASELITHVTTYKEIQLPGVRYYSCTLLIQTLMQLDIRDEVLMLANGLNQLGEERGVAHVPRAEALFVLWKRAQVTDIIYTRLLASKLHNIQQPQAPLVL